MLLVRAFVTTTTCTCVHMHTFELEHVAEVEVPDILRPASLVGLCLGLEDERLSLPAQLESCRMPWHVLI